MSRHSGLAQLKRRCAQDCAVHSSDFRLASTRVERRQADDNSDRQNAPHSQNLTCIPATHQLHKSISKDSGCVLLQCMSPLLAQNGHRIRAQQCPLLGE
jgi:hypothetical protein